MEVKFVKYNGIKGYSRVMYNDVKDADKYKIEVAYDGKDIKALLEYLFELEDKIDKAIEWVHKHISKYNCKGITRITIIDWDELSNPNDLLEILGDEENE